jgi:hypothetical protein
MSSANIELKQVQLTEVVIIGSPVINFQTAYINENGVIPTVQLPEVIVSANTCYANNSMASDEQADAKNKGVFSMPSVSVESSLLESVISLLIALFIPAAG